MMTATDCPTSGELRAFSLGKLPEEQSDTLFRHLQTCPNCRTELETIGDDEDSLVTSLRTPDAMAAFDREPDCQLAVAKALGALGSAATHPPPPTWIAYPRRSANTKSSDPWAAAGWAVFIWRGTPSWDAKLR